MLDLLLIAISSSIVIRDFHTHRISNASTLLLIALLLLNPHPNQFVATIISITVASILFCVAKIGMGDLKLLIGLLVTQGSIVLSADFLYLSLATLAATLISQLIRRRTLRGSVAFAQILLVPFLIAYLAI